MGVLRAFCVLALVQAVIHVEGTVSTTWSPTTAQPAKITPFLFPAETPSGNLRRRQASNLKTCGFFDGVPAYSLTCETGQCHFTTWDRDPQTLLVKCCQTSSSCNYFTSCVDYEDVDPESHYPTNIRICSSGDPVCQTLTWPEITAVAYGCGESSATHTVDMYRRAALQLQLQQQLQLQGPYPRLPRQLHHQDQEAYHQEAHHQEEPSVSC
ncbi:hypothetical protein B0T22DRAFT_241844 [Podospora appendiculata]|uniref:Cyanovirin-N domain-containing protein n=1 Tax=Podospora appendiculata TaxID=314037 RepID=A0AAE0X706_9PEZI|nr:hypothetical protein B0T22DRAFT_241844 [Podospora appendiculata]